MVGNEAIRPVGVKFWLDIECYKLTNAPGLISGRFNYDEL